MATGKTYPSLMYHVRVGKVAIDKRWGSEFFNSLGFQYTVTLELIDAEQRPGQHLVSFTKI